MENVNLNEKDLMALAYLSVQFIENRGMEDKLVSKENMDYLLEFNNLEILDNLTDHASVAIEKLFSILKSPHTN